MTGAFGSGADDNQTAALRALVHDAVASSARGLLWSRSLAVLVAGCLVLGLFATLAGGPVHAEPRDWALAVAATLIGVRVIAHAGRSALGHLFLGVGVTAGLTVGTGSIDTPPTSWVNAWVWWLSYALLPLLLLVFPTGTVRSRWWTGAVVLGLGGSAVSASAR